MKKLLIAILALFVVSAATVEKAHAVASSATGVIYPLTTGYVNGSDWTPIIASTTKPVKGISISSTAGVSLEVGIGLAGTASSGDARQMVIPANTNFTQPLYFPMVTGQGVRISIRNASSTGAISAGTLQLNAFYN